MHWMEDVKAELNISALADWVEDVPARVMRSQLFVSGLFIAILLWEFVVQSLKATKHHFWYDELLTYHVSNLHPFSLVWRALQAGADGMAPGYYALVQLARSLPLDPLLTLRLPSILGYILSLLGVYWFARKKLPASAGLAAMLLITLSSPYRGYAVDARCYSLLVGFLAISAVLWQRIDEKRFMTPLFALFLTLAVSSHHLAIITVSAFGFAELARTILSRRIRWRVWAACLLAASPFFLGLPILLRIRDIFGENFWSRPSWSMVFSTYGEQYLGLDSRLALVLIALFGFVVGALLLRTCRTPRKGPPGKYHFSLPELILIGGFLYFPALLVVLTKLLNSGYTARYGMPAILGLVLGSVFLLRTEWSRPSSIYLLGALLIAFAVQAGSDFKHLLEAGSASLNDKTWTTLAEISRDEPDVPVVIGSGMKYLEAAAYAPLDLRGRLASVVDVDTAIRLAGTDAVDKNNRILAQFVPLRVEDLASFQAAHQRFILRSGGERDWFTQYLIEKKYHLRLLSNAGNSQIYIAER